MSLTRIPGSQVPVLESNGLMSREWYRFLYNLFQLTGGGSTDVTPAELQAEVDTLNTEVGGLTATVATQTEQIANLDEAITQQNTVIATQGQSITFLSESPTSTVPDLSAEVDALFKTPVVQVIDLSAEVDALLQTPPVQVTDLSTEVQALASAPAPAVVPMMAYGSFYDTTTQVAALANTAYAVTFNTADPQAYGVYVDGITSRVYVTAPGRYNFQFSAQFDNTTGGNHLAYIWYRVNGVDATYSASQIRLKGTDGELVPAWNFFVTMAAGDYFELMFSVSDTAVELTAQAAAAPVPGIPSAILTVNQIA